MEPTPSVTPASLARGAVALVHERRVLGSVLTDLKARSYRIAAFDCRKWQTPLDAGPELAQGLAMPVSLPRTMDTVGTWLSELGRSDAPYGDERLRMALVLGVYDDFMSRHRPEALSLLDQLAQASRMAVMFEHRILVVVQSDTPDLKLEAVPTEVIASKQDFRIALWPPPDVPPAVVDNT